MIKGVSELDSVVRSDRPAVPVNLLLVQSCITDLLERRLVALCGYGDLGQPGVCIDVFDLEDEHLVHVLSIAWTVLAAD